MRLSTSKTAAVTLSLLDTEEASENDGNECTRGGYIVGLPHQHGRR